MRSKVIASGLAILLGLVGAVEGAISAPTAQINQQQMSEIDQAIDEGERLVKEESKESLEKANSKQIQKAEADRFLEEGYKYAKNSEYKSALKLFQQSLALYSNIRDLTGELDSLYFIGVTYSALGNYQESITHYQQNLTICLRINDQYCKARVLDALGSSYLNLGQYQDAINSFQEVFIVLQSLRVGELEASSLTRLISRPFHVEALEASSLTHLGTIYREQGQYDKAIKFYQNALTVTSSIGDEIGEIEPLLGLGNIYVELNQDQRAIEFFMRALVIQRQPRVMDRPGEADSLNNLGNAYVNLQQYQTAMNSYQQSLAIAQVIGYREGEGRTLNNIGNLLIQENEPELAIAILKQSVNVYESIRKDNQQLNRELRESYTQKIAFTYQRLSSLLIKQGRLPEAQAVLELLKLKELNTYTRDLSKTSPGISFTPDEQKALDEFLKTYTTASNFARQITECAGKCANLAALETQRDRVNTAIREMLDRLRKTLKDQTIDLSKLNTAEFNDAARAIVNAQPGTILIYPIVTETKIQFLLAFKAGAGDQAPVTFRAIDGDTLNSEDLFKTSDDFRKALGTPSSNLKTLQANSQKLYNWLIKPLESEINQPHIKHLVFATDRATRHIPLAALHDGKTYLINKPYTISTILAAKGTEPAAPRPTAPNILAVGASQFQTANPLRYVEQETQAIVQIFPGDRYLNSQFNFATLKKHLSKHNILHIATHGNLDPVNIDNSYLLTSSGEKIAKPEITLLGDYGLNNIHMVILSACDTGTGGKNTDGLEIAGISHYFMRGGAKSVIASLWQVNDPATALFMQQFYKQLKTGTTKAQAIQQVQQEFIAGKRTAQDVPGDRSDILVQPAPGFVDRQASPANFAHPYYWAPFILIGNSL
jgi:CHAT domain-containing protein